MKTRAAVAAALLLLWALGLWWHEQRTEPRTAHWPPRSFAVFYGQWTHAQIEKAHGYDLIISNGGASGDGLPRATVARLQDGADGRPGTQDDALVFGYLSLGEDEDPHRGPGAPPGLYLDREKLQPEKGEDGLPATVPGSDGIPDRNGAWGSYFVQPDHPAWMRKTLARATRLRDLGVDGFFLDTLDAVGGSRADLAPAMFTLMEMLRREFPDKQLVANRGLDLARSDRARFLRCCAAVLLESWATDWDWALNQGVVSPWLQDNLKTERELLEGVPRLYLNYIDPDQKDRGALLARARDTHPVSWSHPFLDRMPSELPISRAAAPAPWFRELARAEDGQLAVTLDDDECEINALGGDGEWHVLQSLGRRGKSCWPVGEASRVRIRRCRTDGSTSEWSETSIAPRDSFTTSWSTLGLDHEVRCSWTGSEQAVLWTGPGPTRLAPQGSPGASPLRVTGLVPGQLVWVALAPAAGGAPGFARAVRAADTQPPAAPPSARWEWHGRRLLATWEASPGDKPTSYRLYIFPRGQPRTLPFDAITDTHWEGSIPPGDYQVEVTAVDSGNHESEACPAEFEGP